MNGIFLLELLKGTSFSRRRPPPPGSALPVISSISSSTLSPQLNNSHHSETQISPVTLAAPRPETERLTNEYVDTPFRTPKLTSRVLNGVHSTNSTVTTHLTQNTIHRNADGTSNSGDKVTTTNPSNATTTTATSTITDSSVAHSVIGTRNGDSKNSERRPDKSRMETRFAIAATSTDGKCQQKTSKLLSTNNGKFHFDLLTVDL